MVEAVGTAGAASQPVAVQDPLPQKPSPAKLKPATFFDADTVFPPTVVALPPRIALDAATLSEITRRLDAVEAGFQPLARFVEAFAAANVERGQIGGNNPPEAIDAPPPVTPAEIELGAAAIQSMRVELSVEMPRLDVWEHCRRTFDHLAARVQALATWLAADKFADSFAPTLGIGMAAVLTAAVAQHLGVDLKELAALIASLNHGRLRK